MIGSIFAALVAASTPSPAPLFYDDFSTKPSAATYSRCLPDPSAWSTTLSQCGSGALGGGDATAWNPAWGGIDPLGWTPGSAILWAQRAGTYQANLLSKQIAMQKPTSAVASAALKALWYSTMLATWQAFGDGTRTEAVQLPAACPKAPETGSPWGGVWLDSRTNLAEIDFGETDCKGAPSGQVRVTGALHYKDTSGVYHSIPCVQYVPRHIMTVWVERRGDTIVEGIDGTTACTLAQPVEMKVAPMNIIMSQNVTGTTPTTPVSALQVKSLKVTLITQ